MADPATGVDAERRLEVQRLTRVRARSDLPVDVGKIKDLARSNGDRVVVNNCEPVGVDPVEHTNEQRMCTGVDNEALESDRHLCAVDAHERVGVIVDRPTVEFHDESARAPFVECRLPLESDKHGAALVVECDRQHSIIGTGEREREIGCSNRKQ